MFGGPGIGDVRSRLVRLIPSTPDGESQALKTFFNHRLPPNPSSARLEWLEIVEGTHPLWSAISSAKKELIRSFLNTLNMEITKRARPSSVFNFQSASVGNLFLTGARLFTGSFEAAIYLLGSITGVNSAEVIPAINSNFSHHICAGLRNGTSIVGQNSISHPTPPPPTPPSHASTAPTPPDVDLMTPTSERRTVGMFDEMWSHDLVEDANLPGSLPSLRKQNIDFHKNDNEELPARIWRVWYINPYGQEIRPSPNPRVIDALSQARAVVYSIGSLYTSIVPCLILKGVGEKIRDPGIKTKILILNGSLDRETGPSSQPFTAEDFVCAIGNACASSSGLLRIKEEELQSYVSHIIHLEGEGTPKVDRDSLKKKGIETIRVYGKKNPKGGLYYDGKALEQALEAVLGGVERVTPSRRNTVQH